MNNCGKENSGMEGKRDGLSEDTGRDAERKMAECRGGPRTWGGLTLNNPSSLPQGGLRATVTGLGRAPGGALPLQHWVWKEVGGVGGHYNQVQFLACKEVF